MKFTKMHGCGNDYVYVNCFEETVEDRPALARLVSDRHFGVGGDGLICICPSERADFRMDMYNADGSAGEMCGNGIRCVAKYVYEHGMTDKTVIDVETGAGIKTLYLNVEDGEVKTVRVCMGSPEFASEKIPVTADTPEFINQPMEIGGTLWSVTCVNVGNPHAVLFVSDIEQAPLTTLGPKLERHEAFPGGVNVEFVQVLSERELRMRVWERGSGETFACGTGAVASAVASILDGRCEAGEITVHLKGGDLRIAWDGKDGPAFMEGPASYVFEIKDLRL